MPVRSISKGGSEGMKKKNPCKRPLAALLALILTLTLAPAAAAAAERCPYCQSTCEETVLHEAN